MLDFHELYASYAPEVYRFAYWMAGSAPEAEDITSETFIRAWINFGSIRTVAAAKVKVHRTRKKLLIARMSREEV